MDKTIKNCFEEAIKSENKGKKHKGLIFVKPNQKIAEEYIEKAKINLKLCDLYKEKGYDYKIPEEWFYTLYYCALAILTKLGVESRNQRCTALFLKYLKDNELINYNEEYISRIMVYKEKEEKTDVDLREHSRYSSSLKSEEIKTKYETMNGLCLKAINEAEEIIYSKIKLPKKA